ncbi:Formyltransferase [Nemania sp. FL0031]|nr:Formyltransferase [Nemania sp. FL0031]
MSCLLAPSRATTKSVGALFSSCSSRYIALRNGTGYFPNHERYIAVSFFRPSRRYSTTPEKRSDPLHILFCGTDEFSCASLKALHHEHVRNPDLIRSIDVVVRPGKRVGRGRKVVKDSPIQGLAESLGLKVHERDTFTGWDMPTKTNLIIAVSFGLFVPPRLLRAAKYGGLNVHPSLLPDLRGATPLQHTLITGRRLTGISLQTLSEVSFDHGLVLAQTPSDPSHKDALLIPPSCRTTADLQALVTQPAAEMLISSLRAALHVPPLQETGWVPSAAERLALVHAPKITTADRRVSRDILVTCDGEASHPEADPPSPELRGTLARRQDAIGPLWFYSRDRHGRKKRIIIDALEEVPGLSLANRPSMLASSSSSASASPSATPTTPEDTSSPSQYLIPFEDDVGEESQQTPQEKGESQSNMNLVFWSPAAKQEQGHHPRGEDGALYLGNYRILMLKVEGYPSRPAQLALYHFFIN